MRRPTPVSALLGEVVDQRYRVVSAIGSGGMGDVYEVEHLTLGRRLAMKVLRQTRQGNPELARRFLREARAAARLESEHVVSIHDYGELPAGNPYFVMTLLRGRSLRATLNDERCLSVMRAANLCIDVCLGLHAAHALGLVHRDLKPDNLWLSAGADGRELCVLLDFGVVRLDGSSSTADGVLIGTARYMSPEQIGSEQALGPRSDLFSLGVILYEALSGVSPFAADTLERTLFRVLNDRPLLLSEVNPEVPLELAQIVARLLSKDPSERYENALALAACARQFAGEGRLLPAAPSEPARPLPDDTLLEEDAGPVAQSVAARHPERVKRRRAGALAATFALGALGGSLPFWAFPPRGGSPQREAGAEVAALPAAAFSPEEGTPPPASPSDALPAPEAASPEALAPLTVQVAPSARSPERLAAPPPPKKATRSEPPRPSFDDRNPYLP